MKIPSITSLSGFMIILFTTGVTSYLTQDAFADKILSVGGLQID